MEQNRNWNVVQHSPENLLGNGIYFSTTASDWFADSVPNAQNERFLVLARVVLGHMVKGCPNYQPPPSESIDSTVDDLTNPTMFCVFDEYMCYPEYIIKYSTESHEPVTELWVPIMWGRTGGTVSHLPPLLPPYSVKFLPKLFFSHPLSLSSHPLVSQLPPIVSHPSSPSSRFSCSPPQL